MEKSITKSFRIRRSITDICKLLDEFAQAGVSVKAFCNMHSIGKATFYKWQSSYKNKQQEEPTASKTIADIHIIDTGEHAGALFAEVNGIKLYRPVAAACLKELLL